MQTSSTMDAIVKGTTSGLELLLNIVAMLLVLVALVYLANAVLGLLPEIGGAKISLQRLLGYLMAPVCWLMGLPWSQAITAGSLMGTKTVLNELIAYVDLSKLGPDALDPRSRLIMLYAMCGFANFASLGIMIGGLGTMAPERRDEINALGLKSIVSGTLTTCLMGAIVGVMSVVVIARSEATKQSTLALRHDGLLRGACHRARVRATRWLAMTAGDARATPE